MARTSVITMQKNATAIGNGVALPMHGMKNAVIHVMPGQTGSLAGVVTFEASINGTDWVAAACIDISDTNRTHKTTTNAAGIFSFDEYPGILYLRARISTFTSGDFTVIGSAVD